MRTYSSRLNDVTPASLLVGNVPAPGEIGELAVRHAILQTADAVPLAVYADGASASEGRNP